MNTNTAKQVWSYIIKNTKPYPGAIFVLFMVAVVCAIDLSLRPYLLKIILNRLTNDMQTEVFAHLAVPAIFYFSSILMITTSHRFLDYFVTIKMVPRMREKIANDALETLINKSHVYYQNNFSGSLSSKINDLTNSVPDIFQFSFYQFSLQTLSLTIAIVTLWQASIFFALFMLAWSLLFIIGALFYSKHLTRQADNWFEFRSAITGKIVDILSNILSVRLFTAKNEEMRSFRKTFQEAVKAEQKLQWSYYWMWFFYGYSFFILQMLNFYFLCKGRQEGWVTVGDFALVLVINIAIADSLWRISDEFSRFSKLYGQVTQALRSILDTSEPEDKQNAKTLIVSKGQITFSNIKFQYEGAEPLFQNKSVTIESGQKIGLVGYSGSGKTTFVNLILRLYDITDGYIVIDEQDIRDISHDSLCHNIAVVPQDPLLFHRSLLDNIRYGRVDATVEDVIAAAKKAHVHEFISKLPRGYESLVGERGVKLSGGQRQRIAIARAILKNAPILILDEATNQLDSITERNIQESLREVMRDRTTIVIAHRLSTLLYMDRILVFDQGKIVEDGPHSKLLKKGGLYKTLWDAQIDGFLPAQENGCAL
ncbi:MAG TPA: ABC transporter ATP-binding protein [Legionellaceae bacterium]|nr:ABC transporter ATP-binding protein [Legionellaceae bacterium]